MEDPYNNERIFGSLTSKPFNSRIKVNKTGKILEIIIPPVGFRASFGEIFLIVIFYLSMTFVQMLLWVFAFFTLPLLAIVSWRILRDIIFDLTRTQIIKVTASNISISSKFLGLKFSSFIAHQEHISKIEIIPVISYICSDSEGSIGYHPSQLNIWVGNKKIDIDSKDRLTSLEKDWLLNELSAASENLRLKSTATDLSALEGSSEIERETSIAVSKPLGSKVAIEKTKEVLKITIPPRGLQSDSIGVIFGGIVYHLILIPLFCAFALQTSVVWYYFPFLLITPYLFIQDILSRLGQKQILSITASEISLFSELCGFRCSSFTANRRYISKIEIVPITYQIGNGGDRISSPPQLNILTVTKELNLDNGTKLTSPERDWLFYELSDWLDMPNGLRKWGASRE
jgi:hypothetical protein